MALVFADRVQETTTTGFAGTGDVQLNGVPATPLGRVTFADGVGEGNRCKFLIDDAQGNWEIGEGAVSTTGSPHTLTRERVIASSASSAKVNFLAGVKDVTLVATSEDVGRSPHGQCKLSLEGADLKLSRQNGQWLIIGGVSRSIPTDGLSLSASGLSADTTYFIYAAMSGGLMALEASATGHESNSDGVETKIGDSSRTLVGMARTNSSSQFSDSETARLVASYFNRMAKRFKSPFDTGNKTTASTSFVETTSNIRVDIICWEEQIWCHYGATIFHGSANGQVWGALAENPTGALTIIGTEKMYRAEGGSNNAIGSFSSELNASLSEGFHQLTGAIKVASGSGFHTEEKSIVGFLWG